MASKQGQYGKITKTKETEEDKDFKAPGIEGTKDDAAKEEEKKKEKKEEKTFVTGEDVIKQKRAEGYPI